MFFYFVKRSVVKAADRKYLVPLQNHTFVKKVYVSEKQDHGKFRLIKGVKL
jgi:hypothetical protein